MWHQSLIYTFVSDKDLKLQIIYQFHPADYLIQRKKAGKTDTISIGQIVNTLFFDVQISAV